MKNSTKLEKIKKFLEENSIAYKCRNRHRNGHCDLFVIAAKVSVKIEGADDDIFYRRHRKGYHPVFIRSSDTPKFAIEKVANTIRKSMINQQTHLMKQPCVDEDIVESVRCLDTKTLTESGSVLHAKSQGLVVKSAR